MSIISIFNNKGGVGKTTYLFHLAHLLANKGKKVLMIDCDSQCNLSAYSMTDAQTRKAWATDGNSIFRVIEQVYEGLGDIRQRVPLLLRDNLFMIPGDLLLSNFEDKLGDSWNSAKGGSAPDLRVQSAIYRYLLWAKDKISADAVLVDLGPNLGALNRSVLGASDFFIVPVAPDLFSIKGTENLGAKLKVWRQDWDQCNASKKDTSFTIQRGAPSFIGYVIQQHNQRENNDGMTKGWQIFGNELENSIQTNIIDQLKPIGQVKSVTPKTFCLGKIPNLHSLIPYSMDARKPVFECTSADGLKGAHITRARESVQHFDSIVNALLPLM